MANKSGSKKGDKVERGDMSVREAGRLGGQARKEELGHDGYVELGHKGGERVRELIEEGRKGEAEKNKSSKH